MEPLFKYLASREYDRLSAVVVLLALLAGFHATRPLLQRTLPRFSSLPLYRQQHLCMVVPTMLLKAATAAIITSAEISMPVEKHAPHTAMVAGLEYRYNVFYLVVLCYVFELSVTPALLRDKATTIHHTCVIAMSFAFFGTWRAKKLIPVVTLYRIPTVITVLGMGPFDVGLDGVRLVYYGAFPSKSRVLRVAIVGCLGVAWAAWFAQWILVGILIVRDTGTLWRMLNWGEVLLYPCVVVYWAAMEFIATRHFVRLVRKFLAVLPDEEHWMGSREKV
jgi:hypothetical protein